MKNIILLIAALAIIASARAADVVCLRNHANFLPIKDIQNTNIIQIGGIINSGFITRARDYADCRFTYCRPNVADYLKALQNVQRKNLIILINSQLPDNILKMVNSISKRHNCCIAVINNTECLSHIDGKNIILASGKAAEAGSMAARAIFGGAHVTARLSHTIGSYRQGEGTDLQPTRLQFVGLDEEGYRWNYRDTIDSIVLNAIDSACFPGCQIFAARDGKVLINKAYGKFSYGDSCHNVSTSSIYDIASLTKISATTILSMYHHGRGNLNIERTLGKYIRDTVKDAEIWDVSIRSMLEHRSGIYAYPPTTRFSNLWQGWRINARVKGIRPDSLTMQQLRQMSLEEIYTPGQIPGQADIRVADGLWMKNHYQDSLRYFFRKQTVKKRKKYQYSDVNMIYMQWVNEKLAQSRQDEFLNEKFYKPMGMTTTGYLPLKRFSINNIAPTEAHQWTGRMLQGDVHDPAAAFLGGVAGHAGLFTSAKDLAKLYQMLLNGGQYGGQRYLEKETIDLFTSRQPNTTRGLGFDMVPSSFAASVSGPNTYGHTGFTGTCAWVDPDSKIIIVFLCNRIHPTQDNKKLNTMKIRQKICNAVYGF